MGLTFDFDVILTADTDGCRPTQRSLGNSSSMEVQAK
jgi:hypothetical protein